MRDGRIVTLPVKLAERPQRERSTAADAPVPSGSRGSLLGPVGAPARHRTSSTRYHVPDSVRGVVVWRVDAVSPALDADIERGDVILEIDRRPIRSVDDYDRPWPRHVRATCSPSTSTSRAWTNGGSRPSASTTVGDSIASMKPRILVIDDEGAIRDSLRMILEYEDYQFVGAASGQEGLALAQRERPDLVLLDIKMPGMDGMEVLRKLHALDETLPVVMISGHGTTATAVDAIRSGATDFLDKPLSSERVIVTLRNALDAVGAAHARTASCGSRWSRSTRSWARARPCGRCSRPSSAPRRPTPP